MTEENKLSEKKIPTIEDIQSISHDVLVSLKATGICYVKISEDICRMLQSLKSSMKVFFNQDKLEK